DRHGLVDTREFEVYLETPAAGATWEPVRDPQFPDALRLDTTWRRVDARGWALEWDGDPRESYRADHHQLLFSPAPDAQRQRDLDHGVRAYVRGKGRGGRRLSADHGRLRYPWRQVPLRRRDDISDV